MKEDGWVVVEGWIGTAKSAPNATRPWAYDSRTMSFFFSRYLRAFYDAATDQMAANANTDPELIVGIVGHFFYEILYGFVLGTLTSMVMEARKSRQEYEEVSTPYAVERLTHQA
jgi:hypothetical protein